MSGFKGLAIEICDAMERTTGDDFDAMLDWLEDYEGSMAEGVCILIEGDSDVQEGHMVPMYQVGGDLNPAFRRRLYRLLCEMTRGADWPWCKAEAWACKANPQSVMQAILKAYAHGCE
jgi:hypothetical protein